MGHFTKGYDEKTNDETEGYKIKLMVLKGFG